MSPTTDTYVLLRAFVDELARCGCSDACTSPGSRNAPLVLTLARDRRLRCHSHIDERCAGFFALGLAKATGRPAVVTCTSGTAVAELLPAVIEAREARVPLLVLSADRPPELRANGAGQTIDQIKLFGDAAKWFFEVGTHAASEARLRWMRTLACRAWWTALEGRPGVVHLNFALREPLVSDEPLPEDRTGRADGRPYLERPSPLAPTDARSYVPGDRPLPRPEPGWPRARAAARARRRGSPGSARRGPPRARGPARPGGRGSLPRAGLAPAGRSAFAGASWSVRGRPLRRPVARQVVRARAPPGPRPQGWRPADLAAAARLARGPRGSDAGGARARARLAGSRRRAVVVASPGAGERPQHAGRRSAGPWAAGRTRVAGALDRGRPARGRGDHRGARRRRPLRARGGGRARSAAAERVHAVRGLLDARAGHRELLAGARGTATGALQPRARTASTARSRALSEPASRRPDRLWR